MTSTIATSRIALLLHYVRKVLNMGPQCLAVVALLVIQQIHFSICAENRVTVITTDVLPTEHLTGKLRHTGHGIWKRENTLEPDLNIENDEPETAQTNSGRSSSLLSIGEEAILLFLFYTNSINYRTSAPATC